MKFIDEYRDREPIKALSQKIADITNMPCSIMEICGGQTHTILKYNIEELLPKNITLVHGPGCPVCVTPVDLIDKAIYLAMQPNVILVSYGDMLRVPGSEGDLLLAKANGGDVRMVYSPLDATKIAAESPGKKVVFFAIGFETTAPANAMAVLKAQKAGLKNFTILCSHMLVPPAIVALLSGNRVKLDGILAAGHVCTVMGLREYEVIAEKFRIPIVATGFEPFDIMSGIYMVIKLIHERTYEVQNQYSRSIAPDGNSYAKEIIEKVFTRTDRQWRGIGIIPMSGLSLKDEFSEFDALKQFDFIEDNLNPPTPFFKGGINCIAGEILQGIKKPDECSCFGGDCIPDRPLGAPMVSSEGACAAYFHYKKRKN